MVFAVGCAAAAKAEGIDVKVKGQWDFAFGWATNVGGQNGPGWANTVHPNTRMRNDDNFVARHRVRTQINFIASEYLQGVLMFEIGDLNWGNQNAGTSGRGSGAGLDADGVNVETKLAYLDWLIPNTQVSVRMGIQSVTLPAGPMGSPILSDDVAGIVASSPITDMISLTGFWLRPFDRNFNDGDNRYLDDETDAFGLILPVKGNGWKVTPWGVYAFVGGNSGMVEYMYNVPVTATDHTGAWWAGFNFELTMFNPLTFTFDAMYGSVHGLDLFTDDDNLYKGTRGWFIDATLDYKLDWGTPGIFAWWSSGDSKGSLNADGRMGRMPVIGADTGFKATHFGARGTPWIASKNAVMGTGVGTWGVGVQVAKVSFLKDLSHTLKLAYYQGTNSAKGVREFGPGLQFRNGSSPDMYLTDKDRVWEVNFDHEYKIYENLTALLELGYIRLNLDEKTWGRGAPGWSKTSDNAWKAELQFRYSF
jgi:hypothetical protein